MRNGELFNVYCSVKDIVCVFGFCGSGISARVDRLSVLGDLIARHGDGGGHAVAVKHALGSEDGRGGGAVISAVVHAAPSACGKGERVYCISKGVVLIAYGVSALAFYRNGISARGKSVRAEYGRLAFRIGNGNGEVVRRKRAALRSAFNGEVSRGYKFYRTHNGTAVSCGLLRFHGLDRHGSGGYRLFKGFGFKSYIVVARFHALCKGHRRGERYLFARGKGMTRVKAACRDNYGILRCTGYYTGRGKFGHLGGKTERGNIRSRFGHYLAHGYFTLNFPLDGDGIGSYGELLIRAARDVGVACRNICGVCLRVRARVVRQVEPLDRQSHIVYGHGSQRYALLCRRVGQAAFVPSHNRAADVKRVYGDRHSSVIKLIVGVGIAGQYHIQRVAARRGIIFVADFHIGRSSCPSSTEECKRIAFHCARYQAAVRACQISVQTTQIIVQEVGFVRRNGEGFLGKRYVKRRSARQSVLVCKRTCHGNGYRAAVSYNGKGSLGKFKYALIPFFYGRAFRKHGFERVLIAVVNAVKAFFFPSYVGDGQSARGQCEVIAVAQRIGYRVIGISVHNYRSHIGCAYFKVGKVVYFRIPAARIARVQYNFEGYIFIIIYVGYALRDLLFILLGKPFVAYAVTVSGSHIKGVVIYGQLSLFNRLGCAAVHSRRYFIVVCVQLCGQIGLYFKGDGSARRNSGRVCRAAVISGACYGEGYAARIASAVIRDSVGYLRFRYQFVGNSVAVFKRNIGIKAPLQIKRALFHRYGVALYRAAVTPRRSQRGGVVLRVVARKSYAEHIVARVLYLRRNAAVGYGNLGGDAVASRARTAFKRGAYNAAARLRRACYRAHVAVINRRHGIIHRQSIIYIHGGYGERIFYGRVAANGKVLIVYAQRNGVLARFQPAGRGGIAAAAAVRPSNGGGIFHFAHYFVEEEIFVKSPHVVVRQYPIFRAVFGGHRVAGVLHCHVLGRNFKFKSSGLACRALTRVAAAAVNGKPMVGAFKRYRHGVLARIQRQARAFVHFGVGAVYRGKFAHFVICILIKLSAFIG